MSDPWGRAWKIMKEMPEWMKGVVTAMVVLVAASSYMQRGVSADEIVSLRESAIKDDERIKSLQVDVQSLKKNLDRMEGKIDILLTRLK